MKGASLIRAVKVRPRRVGVLGFEHCAFGLCCFFLCPIIGGRTRIDTPLLVGAAAGKQNLLVSYACQYPSESRLGWQTCAAVV